MATSSSKTGRKPKNHICSWNNVQIDGLVHLPDGRWRIRATGQMFREADEKRAVQRFLDWQASQAIETVPVPSTVQVEQSNDPESGAIFFKTQTPAAAFWPWLRTQLIENVAFIAKMTGLPELVGWRHTALPATAIKMADLVQAYKEHAEVTERTRRKVEKSWKHFVRITGATTLDDLTVPKLLEYRDALVKSGLAPDSVDNYMTRIKTVIGFALKRGMDAVQIRAALDRCKVMVAPKHKQEFKPHPISPADFHKLLATANPFWRAALLLSLNACLYCKELLEIAWEDIDMEKGIYLDRRGKTSVIRAASLWPETIDALNDLKKQTPPTSPAIWISARGSTYHPNSFRKVFAQLRIKAGVSAAVEFNNIRDGAYSAAAAAGVEFSLCQLLAGHRLPGESDHYVARNPGAVKPACDAVYAHYGPFPKK